MDACSFLFLTRKEWGKGGVRCEKKKSRKTVECAQTERENYTASALCPFFDLIFTLKCKVKDTIEFIVMEEEYERRAVRSEGQKYLSTSEGQKYLSILF